MKIPDLVPGDVVEHFDELPDSIYTDPIVLAKGMIISVLSNKSFMFCCVNDVYIYIYIYTYVYMYTLNYTVTTIEQRHA